MVILEQFLYLGHRHGAELLRELEHGAESYTERRGVRIVTLVETLELHLLRFGDVRFQCGDKLICGHVASIPPPVFLAPASRIAGKHVLQLSEARFHAVGHSGCERGAAKRRVTVISCTLGRVTSVVVDTTTSLSRLRRYRARQAHRRAARSCLPRSVDSGRDSRSRAAAVRD